MRDDEIFVNHLQSVHKMFAEDKDLFSQEFLQGVAAMAST
jgi:hypothetical protein